MGVWDQRGVGLWGHGGMGFRQHGGVGVLGDVRVWGLQGVGLWWFRDVEGLKGVGILESSGCWGCGGQRSLGV